MPLGREVGRARGIAAGLVGILALREKEKTREGEAAVELLDQLNNVRMETASRVAGTVQQVEELAGRIINGSRV